MFAALEFDHGLFKPQIRWIVVECSEVGRKCGGPIALAPRHDRAYFIHAKTAREDAEAYADYKNRQQAEKLMQDELEFLQQAKAGHQPKRHYAYEWDHLLMAQQPLAWGVLEWSGDESHSGPRIDAAYFTQTPDAELDARVFAFMRDRRRGEVAA